VADPRILLVTGTSKGIGLGLAASFLQCGDVVIGCSRSTAPNLPANGGRYRHFTLDVTDEDAVKSMLVAVRKDHGRLDGLVNNAGIAVMNHSLTTPLASARAVVETNFLGTFLLCREAARVMQGRGGGSIVNFTSVAVPFDLAGEAVYAASKAAVESLTRILARELAPLGIRVNAVGPGPVQTDLIRGVPPDKLQALLARQSVARFSTVDDVVNVVEFFLSPQSGMVTGQVLYLGGP
jgi:3-oxoacyl-[acyl-carrier protein] reductase